MKIDFPVYRYRLVLTYADGHEAPMSLHASREAATAVAEQHMRSASQTLDPAWKVTAYRIEDTDWR